MPGTHSDSINRMVNKYFELSDKLHEGEPAPNSDLLKLEQQELEADIFSHPSQSLDDLARKAALALHMIDDKDGRYHGWEAKESVFRNILHDITHIYAQIKQGAAGPFSPEAPENFYTELAGHLPSDKKTRNPEK